MRGKVGALPNIASGLAITMLTLDFNPLMLLSIKVVRPANGQRSKPPPPQNLGWFAPSGSWLN